MGSRNRFGKKKKEEGSFNKWRRKRGEKKNRNQLKRNTSRLEKLREIKNPNDWQKNQMRNALKLKNESLVKSGKRGMQDDQGDKGKGPASNRVGSTPDKKTWPKAPKKPAPKANTAANAGNEGRRRQTSGNDKTSDNAKPKAVNNKPKKDEWKPTSIQKKLMKGGWTKEELQAKQAAHKKWKADRKAGKLKMKGR